MGRSIRWFVENPIAANLLMIFLLVGGALAVPALDKQFFPRIELNTVSITLPYPGAGSHEVEEQVCVRIEQAIFDLNGVKEIRSTARQGLGTVIVKAERGYDMQRLTAEIKIRVDAIDTFPGEAERPVVTELAHRYHMAVVTLAGDLEERDLKELGERLRDDLASQPHVSVVELATPRRYEVSIEVSEYTLRRYGLTFNDVVAAIRGSSLNLPAGAIKTAEGDLQLQSRGQAYSGADFEAIPLLSTRDGTQILLGDVARVVDGFEDVDIHTRFNGTPSHNLHVYVTSRPNTLATSEVVQNWVKEVNQQLPAGVELTVWQDSALPFRDRVNTLVGNGLGGLVLVFIVLMLFLRPQLAMWVCAGIAVAFMGTFFFMQYAGVSLNMMSLFALLLILGIVVDDAIIVGESIHSLQSKGKTGSAGAIRGARAVSRPVMYAVVSTMVFFAAMLFLPGDLASMTGNIAIVAILALGCSLVESLWILPAHLAPMSGRDLRPLLSREVERVYGPDDAVGYELAGQAVLFQGDYKILFIRSHPGDGQWHLYNIMRDPGETVDLSSVEPVRLQRMLSAYERYARDNNVLPAHLAPMHQSEPHRPAALEKFETFRSKFADGLTDFSRNRYRPFLESCLGNNTLVVALFTLTLFFSLALYGGGWLRASFFPQVQSDYVTAIIKLPAGGPFSTTLRTLEQVESGALLLKKEYNSDPTFNSGLPPIGNVESIGRENEVRVIIESRSEEVDTGALAGRWRELIGQISIAENFDLNYTINEVGKPINLVLASTHIEDLQEVAREARRALEAYSGVYDINDSLESPRQELVLELRPAAENLSITLSDVTSQVRTAFYGAEAQRIPRFREDVRVMVRYPESERLSVNNLRDMRIRTPAGNEVPFDTVASIRFEPGYLAIERLDRKRTLEISANVLPGTSDPRAIVDDLSNNYLPHWQSRFPDLNMETGGELKEESDFLQSIAKYMTLAMIGIYALMAIPFRSYWQPLLVLTAVPFGIMGAIFGHIIMGLEISLLSLLGVVACAGVVVNDNLVLIDRINLLRVSGNSLGESLLQAGEDRFRPIVLTSVTTFVGLLPIMSETSFQAQFLIPMVVSLAFGVLFASGVTLLLVPCLFLLGTQVSTWVRMRCRWGPSNSQFGQGKPD